MEAAQLILDLVQGKRPDRWSKVHGLQLLLDCPDAFDVRVDEAGNTEMRPGVDAAGIDVEQFRDVIGNRQLLFGQDLPRRKRVCLCRDQTRQDNERELKPTDCFVGDSHALPTGFTWSKLLQIRNKVT